MTSSHAYCVCRTLALGVDFFFLGITICGASTQQLVSGERGRSNSTQRWEITWLQCEVDYPSSVTRSSSRDRPAAHIIGSEVGRQLRCEGQWVCSGRRGHRWALWCCFGASPTYVCTWSRPECSEAPVFPPSHRPAACFRACFNFSIP